MVNFITVTSGSGGMGKSIFSCNVSSVLKTFGYKVLLVECSFGTRADDVISSIEPDTLYTLSDICMSKCKAYDAITYPENNNLPDFISAGVSKSGCDFKSVFQKLKSQLSKEYDYIICDLPSYFDNLFEAVVSVSNTCIILTDDNFVSVRNAAFCSGIVRSHSSADIYAVINNVTLMEDDKLSAEDIADEISAPILGIIPSDEHIKTASARGELIYKYNTFAGRAYENICKRLTGTPVPEYETGINNGIFNKNRFTLK